MRRSHLAIAAVAATVLLWGSAFAAIRTAVAELGPVPLSVARLVVASLVLAVVAPFFGVGLPRRADLPRVLLCGATGIAGYQLLLNTGQVSVPAGTASLLVATAPVHAALLARVFLGERISPRAQLGIAVAFAGAVTLGLGRGAGAAGTLLLLPLGARTPTALAELSAAGWASLAWLGVGASALGFVTWSVALARLPVAGAVSTLNLVPLVAVAAGWLLQGDVPTVLVLVGSALAVGGVLLVRGGTPATHVSDVGSHLGPVSDPGRLPVAHACTK
jgi:drug/metabolite transporter (DMT)-like permease